MITTIRQFISISLLLFFFNIYFLTVSRKYTSERQKYVHQLHNKELVVHIFGCDL